MLSADQLYIKLIKTIYKEKLQIEDYLIFFRKKKLKKLIIYFFFFFSLVEYSSIRRLGDIYILKNEDKE